MKTMIKFALLAFLFCTVYSGIAQAADYYCEVMTLKGSAQLLKSDGSKAELKQGDLLAIGDTVIVADDSFVDVAYDKQWNNVTRLGAGTSVKIKSVFPTGLAMSKGDIFAKLAKLPAKSTFEIETPTAIAAVRGSAYRTLADEKKTDVYNMHDSEVEVHSKGASGEMMDDKVVLKENEKTEVGDGGQAPKEPEKMTDEEIKKNKEVVSGVEEAVDEAKTEGREGNIQDIETIEKEYGAELDKRLSDIIKEKELESDPQKDIQDKDAEIVEKIEREKEKIGNKQDKDQDRRDDRRKRGRGDDGKDGKGSKDGTNTGGGSGAGTLGVF